MSTLATATDRSEVRAAQTSPARAAFWAAVLGIVVLIGVGFTPGPAHNAAHDTRHSFAFPCH